MKKVEEQLLLQIGEETIGVKNLSGKAIILKLDYTNDKWAAFLEGKGVPWIKDKTSGESRTKALTKRTLFAFREGGGPKAVKPILMKHTGSFIEGTGKQMTEICHESSVNGLELFDVIAQLATDSGDDVYIRSKKLVTQTKLSCHEEEFSDTTKIYFIPVDKVDEKMKKGTGSKKFPVSEAREVLRDLIDATWIIEVYRNPTSTVFSLRSRQPENKNPNLKPSPFSF